MKYGQVLKEKTPKDMKSKRKTVLLCLFFGGFGIHRYYLGDLELAVTWPSLLAAITAVGFTTPSVGAALFGLWTVLLLVEFVFLATRDDVYYEIKGGYFR